MRDERTALTLSSFIPHPSERTSSTRSASQSRAGTGLPGPFDGGGSGYREGETGEAPAEPTMLETHALKAESAAAIIARFGGSLAIPARQRIRPTRVKGKYTSTARPSMRRCGTRPHDRLSALSVLLSPMHR